MRRAPLTLIAIGAMLACAGCPPPEGARALRVESRDQLIGGPDALGEIGDYLLENGRVRFIIHDVGFSRGNVMYGGGLIDADLVRPRGHGSSRGGDGEDRLGELFPGFFLEFVDPREIEVTAAGGGDEPARITVRGRANELLALTEFLNKAVLDPDTLRFETEYALAPGARHVEITSRVINDDPRGRSHPFHNIEFNGVRVPIPMGDALIFSGKTSVFFPGDSGFSQRLAFEERYPLPMELPGLPGLVPEFIAAIGDGVSYGLLPAPAGEASYVYRHRHLYEPYPGTATDHSLVVPFTASGVTPAYYAYPPDMLGPGEAFSFKRYFIVGSGDVASVRDAVHELLEEPVGQLAGRVRERPSSSPVAGASVVVLDQGGRPVNQLRADADGTFRGDMRPGVYRAIVVVPGRRSTTPVPFAIEEKQRTFLELQVAAAARLLVSVRDSDGRRLPARATLVGTSSARDIGRPPHHHLYLPEIGESFRFTDMVEDGEADETRRYIEAIFIGHEGNIVGEARPGRYQVWVSRGPEYSVSMAEVELRAGETRAVSASLHRSVDTRGYLSADFHLHSQGSVDSDAWLDERLIDGAAEGLEVAVSTDHNMITQYAPTISALGLEQWITSLVGVELTTLELGHFNAYPLRYQVESVTHGVPRWQLRAAPEIFADLRTAGEEDCVVQVNHPRASLLNYFSQFSLDSETLELRGRSGLLAPNPETHPEYLPQSFSWDFDAIELLNGKRLDSLHNYAVPTPLPPPPLPDEVPAAGTVLRNEDGMVAFPGVVDDWLTMLEAGRVYTGTANSDSHHVRAAEIGYPRTYIGVPDDDPGVVAQRDIVAAVRHHDAVMSNCPFVRALADEAGPGDTATAEGGRARLRVTVETSSFCSPDELLIYVGREVVRRVQIPPDQTRRFQTEVSLEVPRDSFVVVEVVGKKSLFPIVPGEEMATDPENDAFGALGASFGLFVDSWRNLRPQIRHTVTPYALTNPIFIDADGDGAWTPTGATP